MKRRSNKLAVLFVMACLAGLAVGQVARLPKVQVLETGAVFHGNEVKARSGERWLGLYVTEGGSELLESTVKITRVRDEIVDQDELSATGKGVSVDRQPEPLLLVKNAPMLKPGKVVTVFRADKPQPFSLAQHRLISLKLGEQVYQLRVTGSRSGDPAELLPLNARCFLFAGQARQLLYSIKGLPGGADWTLLWAGDLDGDGKLDLYANLTYHYNVSQRKLFLSSQARPGQLVREVGEFVTTGC